MSHTTPAAAISAATRADVIGRFVPSPVRSAANAASAPMARKRSRRGQPVVHGTTAPIATTRGKPIASNGPYWRSNPVVRTTVYAAAANRKSRPATIHRRPFIA